MCFSYYNCCSYYAKTRNQHYSGYLVRFNLIALLKTVVFGLYALLLVSHVTLRLLKIVSLPIIVMEGKNN